MCVHNNTINDIHNYYVHIMLIVLKDFFYLDIGKSATYYKHISFNILFLLKSNLYTYIIYYNV